MSRTDCIEKSALWNGGWYKYAMTMASPNFGPRPAQTAVDLVVLHSISLPPGEYGGDAVGHFFCNQLDLDQHPYFKSLAGLHVSSHFYIRRHGELLQFVSADERAWHAGASSYGESNNCNDNSIGIELEGIEGGLFEHDQYETLVALCSAILQRYPITAIAGHEHIAPVRKTDPGPGFDWFLLQQGLGLASRFFPEREMSRVDARA
ncbi:MAG: 1,6-anhydro-N-acetylmuramyl-L-alanine amidase AmpD [Comamonadaceae bacterium]